MDMMTLEQFREEFALLLETTEKNKHEEALLTYLAVKRHTLPLFPKDHLTEELYEPYSPNPKESFNDAVQYKNLYYCDFDTVSEPNTIFVDPLQTIGDTWLYENDRSEGRPCPNRLARILLGKPENLPDFFAPKMGKFYYCTDGNHRVYAAFLLGRKVKVECCEEYQKIFNAKGEQLK